MVQRNNLHAILMAVANLMSRGAFDAQGALVLKWGSLETLIGGSVSRALACFGEIHSNFWIRLTVAQLCGQEPWNESNNLKIR
jgi:hypothetical protein